jgi:hypothetical protein
LVAMVIIRSNAAGDLIQGQAGLPPRWWLVMRSGPERNGIRSGPYTIAAADRYRYGGSEQLPFRRPMQRLTNVAPRLRWPVPSGYPPGTRGAIAATEPEGFARRARSLAGPGRGPGGEHPGLAGEHRRPRCGPFGGACCP